MHLAVLLIAFCMAGTRHIGHHEARTGLPRPFPRLIGVARRWLMARHLCWALRCLLRAAREYSVITNHRGTCKAKEYTNETNAYESSGGDLRGDGCFDVAIAVGWL